LAAGRFGDCLSTAEPIEGRGGLLIVCVRRGREGRLGGGGGVGRAEMVVMVGVEEDLEGGIGGGARLPKVVVVAWADFCWLRALMRSFRDENWGSSTSAMIAKGTRPRVVVRILWSSFCRMMRRLW